MDVNIRKGFEMSTREEAEIKAIHDGVYHAWRNWLNENRQAIIEAIASRQFDSDTHEAFGAEDEPPDGMTEVPPRRLNTY
jgi:hypothetical protein